MKTLFAIGFYCLSPYFSWGQVRMIPHVTKVGGGFETTVYAENSGSDQASFSLQGYDEDGNPLTLVTQTLDPGTIESFPMADLFGSSSAISHFTIVNTDETLRIFVSYRIANGPGSAAHLMEKSTLSKRWRLFPGDWDVIFDGIAVINMGSSSTDIKVSQIDFDGDPINSVIVKEDLAPLAKALYVIGAPGNKPFLPQNASFEVSGSQELAIIALRGTPPGASTGYLWENTTAPLSEEIVVPQEGEFFVSAQNGNDSGPGTANSPWKTIQHAADVLNPGETATIMAGTYYERVIPKHSGTADKVITYRAFPGDIVNLDGTGIALAEDDIAGLFEIMTKSYLTVSGIRVMNVGPNMNNVGILASNSDHIRIENNYTYNTVSSGIGVWSCSNITIDGNEVELACNDGEQECITVAVTDSFEISNNHVHHGGPGTHGGEGIDAKDGSTHGIIHHNHVHHLNNRLGIYIDAWDKPTHDMEIYQNEVHDIANNDGFTLSSESGGLLQNIHIYNNIAYNNGLSGITLSENGDAPTHPMKDITIINNTFVGNGGSEWGGGIEIGNKDLENIVIRNNICSQNVNYQIYDDSLVSTVSIDHNLIDGFRGELDEEVRGTDFLEGDPLFISPNTYDFHLMSGSPAIDSGSSISAPSFDFDGISRPIGTGIDRGAYEQ